MTCYSARYLGDKINTYHSHEEYLLQKLTRKIERKYELTSLGKLAPIFSRGYYTSNGHIVKWSSWYDKWTIIGELYECPHFYDEIITYIDCPCVYFDFRYYPNNFNSYEHVTPDVVLDTLKEASMIDQDMDLIVLENLRHSSNATYFKVIIPVKYYGYREEFTYENKKISKVLNPNTREYRLILDFLIMNYRDLFNRIYMIPNYEEHCMEYYLRYKGLWHFDYRNQINRKILAELFVYGREHDLIEFLNNICIYVTTELED